LPFYFAAFPQLAVVRKAAWERVDHKSDYALALLDEGAKIELEATAVVPAA